MGIDIYFHEDIAQHTRAGVCLMLRTAQMSNTPVEFILGVLAMAEHQTTIVGENWPGLLGQVRASLGTDLVGLLDEAMSRALVVPQGTE